MTPADLRTLPASETQHLPPLVHALWHDAQDDWTAAHELAQDIDTPDGARVHAYLHRKEGDDFNAAYWYRLAGQPIARGSLDDEWADLAAALLRS